MTDKVKVTRSGSTNSGMQLKSLPSIDESFPAEALFVIANAIANKAKRSWASPNQSLKDKSGTIWSARVCDGNLHIYKRLNEAELISKAGTRQQLIEHLSSLISRRASLDKALKLRATNEVLDDYRVKMEDVKKQISNTNGMIDALPTVDVDPLTGKRVGNIIEYVWPIGDVVFSADLRV